MELISNVSFNNQTDYQLMYVSQLYGTLFAVYGKFILKKGGKDEEHYFLDGIDLAVLNYKGMINLGITKHKFHYDKKNMDAILKLEVRALHGKDQLRVECKGAKFKKDGTSYLHVDRRVKQLHDKGKPIINGIFDKEFYYREGVKWNEKGLKRDGRPNFEARDMPKTPAPMGFGPAASPAVAGPMCPKSKITIL